MITRSGKTYNFNKCRCGIYYKSPIFKHRCSQCFSIKYPQKWQKFIKDQWTAAHHIPSNILESFLDEYAIDAKNTLKLIQYTIIQAGIAPSTSISIIFQILNHWKNKGKLGIRAKDAADIYRKFKEIYPNCDWRIQHLISGLILDYWNITSNDHGSVAYCYYGLLGNKPRGLTTDILPCPIMGSNSNNKRHYEKYRFWDQSISGIRPMAANS